MKSHQWLKILLRSLLLTILAIVCIPVLTYLILVLQRPEKTRQDQILFQGIKYQRFVHTQPRPFLLHLVTIDLTAPGIGILVTPKLSPSTEKKMPARTTSEFVKEFNLQLGINANFFFPCIEKHPWDYYPRSGELVTVLGQAISNGIIYSQNHLDWPSLCFNANYQAQIQSKGFCPQGTMQAISGESLLVENGQPKVLTNQASFGNTAYARTAVGINQKGNQLWLVLVDGKQPFYSEGMTLPELQQFMVKLGVDGAINLDGGGSTTLVTANRFGIRALNAPIQSHVPMRQRPIANHLGFYAKPLE